MANARIGYRQVYGAVGCLLAQDMSFNLRGVLPQGITAEVYIGPEPTLPVLRYFLPKHLPPVDPKTNKPMSRPFQPQPVDAGDSIAIYTDIRCWVGIYITDELDARLRSQDHEAEQVLLEKAETHSEELHAATDLIAGTIALRNHRQLVMEKVASSYLAHNKYTGQISARSIGAFKELLDLIKVPADYAPELATTLQKAVTTDNNKWRFNSLVMKWLLRAWEEEDEAIKFLSLFVPLEIMLNEHKLTRPEGKLKLGKTLKSVVSKAKHVDQSAMDAFLAKLIDRYTDKPTLLERFEDLAAQAQLPGWQEDITAFDTYNMTRNAIVHRGETDIKKALAEAEQNVFMLQDLTERYVSYAIFGDPHVYVSRARRLDMEVKNQTP